MRTSWSRNYRPHARLRGRFRLMKGYNELSDIVLRYVQLGQSWECFPKTNLGCAKSCRTTQYYMLYNDVVQHEKNGCTFFRNSANEQKNKIEKKLDRPRLRTGVFQLTVSERKPLHYSTRTGCRYRLFFLFIGSNRQPAVKRSVKRPLGGCDATGHVVTSRCSAASLALDRAS